ncbi:hypothetical protein [Streptomyces mirabilis]|uniref:hypothetical protein n=1 Tax=Streptomyces mirabilis TaxID=68239 RepID=UPI0036742BCE
MTAWKRALMWVAAGAFPAGVISYVAVVGLSRADQTASVVGAVAGVVALGLAVAAEVRASRAPTPTPLPPVRAQGDYGGDHIDFSGSTFHNKVTGKETHHHHGPDQYPPTP